MTTPEPDEKAPASPSSPTPQFRAPTTVTAPGIKMLAGNRRPSRTPSTPRNSPAPSASSTDSGPADPLATEPPSRAATGTRSPGSKPGPVPEFDSAAVKDIARGLLLGATALLHNYLARTEDERAQQVWVADEDDQAAIADPLAKIAGRRGGPAMANPDMADLLTAGFGALGYAVKNGMKALNARKAERVRKKVAAGNVNVVGTQDRTTES